MHVDEYISHLLDTGATHVSALLRVVPGWQPPTALNISSRIGTVVSCSLTRETLTQLAKDPGVLAVEASR